jgi:hypothetical protein
VLGRQRGGDVAPDPPLDGTCRDQDNRCAVRQHVEGDATVVHGPDSTERVGVVPGGRMGGLGRAVK